MNNECYLKITHASDSVLEPEHTRIIYGDIAQYHLLKKMAIAYTSTEKHLAFVGFVGHEPEKTYFGGREVLVVTQNDIERYYTFQKGKIIEIVPHTFAYYEENAK
jgi:hypothetical protein